MKRWGKQKGFTIVELLIVIVVIAILAAISIVAYNGIQGRSAFAKVNSDLISMKKLLELYKVDNGSYPSTNWTFTYRYRDGNDFIPGLVPMYAASLPTASSNPDESSNKNTYVYYANGPGTAYRLQRLYQPEVPKGEWSQVSDDMKQGSLLDRYGYNVGY